MLGRLSNAERRSVGGAGLAAAAAAAAAGRFRVGEGERRPPWLKMGEWGRTLTLSSYRRSFSKVGGVNPRLPFPSAGRDDGQHVARVGALERGWKDMGAKTARLSLQSHELVFLFLLLLLLFFR